MKKLRIAAGALCALSLAAALAAAVIFTVMFIVDNAYARRTYFRLRGFED